MHVNGPGLVAVERVGLRKEALGPPEPPGTIAAGPTRVLGCWLDSGAARVSLDKVKAYGESAKCPQQDYSPGKDPSNSSSSLRTRRDNRVLRFDPDQGWRRGIRGTHVDRVSGMVRMHGDGLGRRAEPVVRLDYVLVHVGDVVSPSLSTCFAPLVVPHS